MHITDCPLKGLKLIHLKRHADERGYFTERFQEETFRELGLPTHFPQDNHSRSLPGVIRGMHCQHTPPQSKLISVLRGRILDVVIDIRPDSATYGEHHRLEIDEDASVMLWIPAGFAHGFCVLGDAPADVLYRVTSLYAPAQESGIRYDDPEIGIDWPVKNPILSKRDLALGSFADYRLAPPRWS